MFKRSFRYQDVGLRTLEYKRERADMIKMYKIVS